MRKVVKPARRGHLRGRHRGPRAPDPLHGHRREPRQVPAHHRLRHRRALLRAGLLAQLQRRVARRRTGAPKARAAHRPLLHPSAHPLSPQDDGFQRVPERGLRAGLVPRLLAAVVLCPLDHIGATSALALTPARAPCRAQGVPARAAPGTSRTLRHQCSARAALAAAAARAAAAAQRARSRQRASPPPPPPPPAPYFQKRESATETDYDDDCELVSYATCRGIVADYAREHGTADVLRVSFAPCEGLDLDEGCFRVRLCAPLMANRLHCRSPLLPHARRAAPTAAPTAGCSTTCCPTCSPSSTRPTRVGAGSRSCRTARAPTSPWCTTRSRRRRPSRLPRTTTPTRRTTRASTSWAAAPRAVFDAEQGQASALVKRMTNVHTIDLALRSSHRTLQCPGETTASRRARATAPPST